MILPNIRCHRCDAPDVACVAPGSEPRISEASDILVERGAPVVALCLACWPALRGWQGELGL